MSQPEAPVRAGAEHLDADAADIAEETEDAVADGLPTLAHGPRRGWLAGLVALGLAQAALGLVMAWAMIRLQGPVVGSVPLLALLTLALVIAGIGMLRVHERVIAERLGQHYVREVRGLLLSSVLTPGEGGSLGITVARTTNDLTAVRNWVAQGVAAMAVAVPLLVGVTAGLALLDWRLALTVALPMALLGTAVAAWSGQALRKARTLRRTRGRMASRIAETVTAADGITAAGGSARELRNLAEISEKLGDQAVDRAETLGMLRSAGTVSATLVTVLVAVAGSLGGVPAGVIVAGMAIAGIAAAPIMDLGRVVEFRQNFLAARMVLAPVLLRGEQRRADREAYRALPAIAPAPNASGLHAVLPGLLESRLVAEPGDRIALTGPDTALHSAVRRLSGLDLAEDGVDDIHVDGCNLRTLPDQDVRRLRGVAQAGQRFEHGTVLRAVRYRRPDLSDDLAEYVLGRVGLSADALPEGYATKLRGGGDPLDRQQRARLALGRALYGTPGLVVLDRLEADLDQTAVDQVVELLGSYRGVIVLIGCPQLTRRLAAREILVAGSPAPEWGQHRGYGWQPADTDHDHVHDTSPRMAS